MNLDQIESAKDGAKRVGELFFFPCMALATSVGHFPKVRNLPFFVEYTEGGREFFFIEHNFDNSS